MNNLFLTTAAQEALWLFVGITRGKAVHWRCAPQGQTWRTTLHGGPVVALRRGSEACKHSQNGEKRLLSHL